MFEGQCQFMNGNGNLDGGIFVLGIEEGPFTADVDFGNVQGEADVGIVYHLVQIQISAEAVHSASRMIRNAGLAGFKGKGAVEGSGVLRCWALEVHRQIVGDGHGLPIGDELGIEDGEGRKGNGEGSESDVSPCFGDSGMESDLCGLAMPVVGF
jgi:hypothetical protein